MGPVGAIVAAAVGFALGFLAFDVLYGVGHEADRDLVQYMFGGLGAILALLLALGRQRWRR
jgi:hypothetical protein